MIVVDTSVWVAARRQQRRVADVLGQLIDADEVALALNGVVPDMTGRLAMVYTPRLPAA